MTFTECQVKKGDMIMKKSNKVISLFIVLTVAFSMLAMTANAATSYICQLDLELNIADGTVLGDWNEYITIKTDNVVCDDFNGNPCVDAMCTEDYVHVMPTESFEGGKTYDIRMFFTVEDGYCFADTMSKVTVNGVTVDPDNYSVGYEYSYTTDEDYQYLAIMIESFKVETELTEIEELELEVNITDGTVLGDWNEYITIQTDNVVCDDFNGNPCVDAMCTEDYVHIMPTESFESGKTYDIRMFFAVEEGYCFAENMKKVTINGETVDADDYSVGYEYVNGTSEEYQYIVVCMEDFTVPEEVVEFTFWQKLANFFIGIFKFFFGFFM